MENSIKCVAYLANYLKVPVGKIYTTEEQTLIRECGNRKSSGFFNTIASLLNESGLEQNSVNKAELYQWLEYALTYASHHKLITRDVLNDLNKILSTRSYLIGSQQSFADVIMYYFVFQIMEDISNADKENYMNVSRWFDNLQNNPKIRLSNPFIDFRIAFLRYQLPREQ